MHDIKMHGVRPPPDWPADALQLAAAFVAAERWPASLESRVPKQFGEWLS